MTDETFIKESQEILNAGDELANRIMQKTAAAIDQINKDLPKKIVDLKKELFYAENELYRIRKDSYLKKKKLEYEAAMKIYTIERGTIEEAMSIENELKPAEITPEDLIREEKDEVKKSRLQLIDRLCKGLKDELPNDTYFNINKIMGYFSRSIGRNCRDVKQILCFDRDTESKYKSFFVSMFLRGRPYNAYLHKTLMSCFNVLGGRYMY
jgi:hypothetical protein